MAGELTVLTEELEILAKRAAVAATGWIEARDQEDTRLMKELDRELNEALKEWRRTWARVEKELDGARKS